MGCSSSSDIARDPNVPHIAYFKGVHGRAEPIKAMLSHKGTPHRIELVGGAGFVLKKKMGNNKTEFKGLPMLYYKGQEMAQTLAILRMLGIEHGYYNPTDW